jgi:hypothetical protein
LDQSLDLADLLLLLQSSLHAWLFFLKLNSVDENLHLLLEHFNLMQIDFYLVCFLTDLLDLRQVRHAVFQSDKCQFVLRHVVLSMDDRLIKILDLHSLDYFRVKLVLISVALALLKA